MSNYVTSNLIPVTPEPNRLAIRVDDKVFLAARPGDADVSDTTATAADVLSGKVFRNSAGVLTSGGIQIQAGQIITPSTSDQYILSGLYLGGDQIVKGDAALVASNIVSGASIFGVSGNVDVGTVVSDTTATAADVLYGKVFYNSGGVQTSGTIPGYVGALLIPTTSSQTVSAGVYLSGAVTVPGDANLVASNIVSGVSIFGVSGTAQAGGSSGGKIYLCVSASDPTYYHINADTYGGDYYRDGDYTFNNGSSTTPVYTNGIYYYMPTSNYNGYNYSSWALYSSRSNDDQYKIMYELPPWEGAEITSGGQMVMITPRRLSSGTWTGREMAANSAGYYEPISSATSLTYTKIVPNGGEMYTADALKHIDQIWNYDYKRDLKGFFSSTQNEMYPNSEAWFEGVSGPDTGGWFTFGDGAYGSYNGYSYDAGGSLFSAKFDNFTFAFKFKYASGTLSEDGNHNCIFRLEGGYSLFQLQLDPNGAIRCANRASVEGDTELPYTLQADTEYSFVITCDQSRMRVIVNGLLIADWRSARNGDAISTVYVHWYGDSASEATFSYKEMSLWGRVLDEAVYSSAAMVPVMNSSMGSAAVCMQGVTVGSVILGSANRLTVAGTVMSAVVESTAYCGLYIMSGGIVSAATVSSGGRMVVYSGGTALNVTSQAGADINVSSGGSISYVQ